MDTELIRIGEAIESVVPYVTSERAKLFDDDGELHHLIAPKDVPDLESAVLGHARQTLRQAETALAAYIASQEERIAKTEVAAESALRGDNLTRLTSLSALYEQDARRDPGQFVRQMKAASFSNDRVEQLACLRAARAILPKRGSRPDPAIAPEYVELHALTERLAELTRPEWAIRERAAATAAIADAQKVISKMIIPVHYLDIGLQHQRTIEQLRRDQYRARMEARGLDYRTGEPLGAGRRR